MCRASLTEKRLGHNVIRDWTVVLDAAPIRLQGVIDRVESLVVTSRRTNQRSETAHLLASLHY